MSFDDALLAAQGEWDGAFGRPYRIDPITRQGPNTRPVPDDTRASVEIVGILSEVHSRAGAENGPSQFDATQAGHTTSRLQVSVLASSIPYRPRRGDRLVDLRTGDLLVIAEVRVEFDGRLALDVNSIVRPDA